ncbi:MAG: flagellar protein FlaG [Nitrospirae bacterium]|nr:flagellar protein FlaG [Nitrospirota bacterium]
MINGIFRQENLENVPTAEIRNRSFTDAERTENQKEKAVNSDNIKKDEKIDTEEAMEKVEQTARLFNRKIHLEVEEELDMMIVKVIDSETQEVIRQIPSEEFVELSKNARDLKGLLINKEG